MISEKIKGYEYVKNVTVADGYERCDCDKLFVVRRGDGDYLDRLCEVAENTRENRIALEKKYPNEEYIIWWGEVVYNLEYDDRDEIHFYWS